MVVLNCLIHFYNSGKGVLDKYFCLSIMVMPEVPINPLFVTLKSLCSTLSNNKMSLLSPPFTKFVILCIPDKKLPTFIFEFIST